MSWLDNVRDFFTGGSADSDKTNTPGGSHDGIQQSIGENLTLTVNSAGDKQAAPGSYYQTVKNEQTGEKATAVYNSDNTFADVKTNKVWKDAPARVPEPGDPDYISYNPLFGKPKKRGRR